MHLYTLYGKSLSYFQVFTSTTPINIDRYTKQKSMRTKRKHDHQSKCTASHLILRFKMSAHPLSHTLIHKCTCTYIPVRKVTEERLSDAALLIFYDVLFFKYPLMFNHSITLSIILPVTCLTLHNYIHHWKIPLGCHKALEILIMGHLIHVYTHTCTCMYAAPLIFFTNPS